MNRRTTVIAALIAIAAAGRAGAQESLSRKDFLASLQRVGLDADGSWWLSVAGHARYRGEGWHGYSFGGPATADPNDSYSLGRFFLSVDVHAGNTFRALVEGKSSIASDRTLVGGRRTSDEDALDLQQAFVELTVPAGPARLSVRAGRQELALGRERLVTSGDWNNTRKTFEGFTGRLAVGNWAVQGLFVAPVIVQSYAFNQRDQHTLLYGAYATNPRIADRTGLDLYWLGVRRDTVVVAATGGREVRHTVGARLWYASAAPGLDYEVETARQFGTLGAHAINAWMAAGVLGATVSAAALAPRVYVGADYASGDVAAGGRVGTFSQLFGTAHRFHGYMDVNGGQNLVDWTAGASVKWLGVTGFALDLHRFDRASRGDVFYSATLTTSRAAGSGLARHIGDELDVTVRYPFGRHVLTALGYGHYIPGLFVRQTGMSKAMDFTYLSTQFTL